MRAREVGLPKNQEQWITFVIRALLSILSGLVAGGS